MNRLAIIIMGVMLSALTLYPQSGGNGWGYTTVNYYPDRVSLANDYINGEKSKFYWEPATKTMVNLLYNVGFTAARYGGRYILLESPDLALDMVKGGAYALSNIAYDELLEIIKQAVKTPDKLCVSIAQSTKKEGVKAYNAAYEIAQKQRETGRITEAEAEQFLLNMWNSFKCAAARTLYIESQAEYDIDDRVAERAVNEILDQLEPALKAKLDLQSRLPLIEAARFIKDVSDILESKKIGLADYPPYQHYVKTITDLNTYRLNELGKIGQGNSIPAGSGDEYLIIPGVSVGPINFNTTINDLYQFYGKENVETTTGYYEGEGTELATHTIIKNRGLTIRWKDQVTQDPRNPRSITINGDVGEYHTAEGIKVGTSFQEMTIINGKSIDYRDMGVEPSKMVSDWRGGTLEKYGRADSHTWTIKLDYADLQIVGFIIGIKPDNLNSSPVAQANPGNIVSSGETQSTQRNSGSSPNTQTAPQVKLLRLISPKGGESLLKGQDMLVSWEVSESPGTLAIMLESDAESKLLIAYNKIEPGSTRITIPHTIHNGSRWHILLVAKSPALESRVKSGNFTIGGDEEYTGRVETKDMTTRSSSLINNLISYWMLDESSGGIAYDSHSTNHCNVQTGVSINQEGLIGRAASFIETSGGLTTNKVASQLGIGGNTSKSVSIWIKPSRYLNGANSCGIISLGSSANQKQFGIKYYGLPAYWMFDSWYGAVRIGPDNVKLDDGRWHHIVVTYNSDAHRVNTYLDGRLSTSDASKTLYIGDQMAFSIGIGSQGKYTGLIDEVGLWSRDLTDREVQMLYNQGSGWQYPFSQ